MALHLRPRTGFSRSLRASRKLGKRNGAPQGAPFRSPQAKLFCCLGRRAPHLYTPNPHFNGEGASPHLERVGAPRNNENAGSHTHPGGAGFSACGGLALGCTVDQQHVQHGDDPDDFLRLHLLPRERAQQVSGSAKAGAAQPTGLRSEGLRASLVPQFPHLSLAVVLIALTIFDLLFPSSACGNSARKLSARTGCAMSETWA